MPWKFLIPLNLRMRRAACQEDVVLQDPWAYGGAYLGRYLAAYPGKYLGAYQSASGTVRGCDQYWKTYRPL